MNWFFQKNRKVGRRFSTERAEESQLMHVLDFIRSLELPEPHSKIEIRMEKEMAGRREAPYYILVYGGEEEGANLNAGYIAGQSALYLKFLGYTAYIERRLPVWTQSEKIQGKHCIAVVAFGKRGDTDKKTKDMKEKSCICLEPGERWSDEVLSFARKHFALASRTVSIQQKENCLYFEPKVKNGKKQAIAELETGITAAKVMSAAEELWVDLSLSVREHNHHTICVCRRVDA